MANVPGPLKSPVGPRHTGHDEAFAAARAASCPNGGAFSNRPAAPKGRLEVRMAGAAGFPPGVGRRYA